MATWELLITRIWLYIVFCEKFLFVFFSSEINLIPRLHRQRTLNTMQTANWGPSSNCQKVVVGNKYVHVGLSRNCSKYSTCWTAKKEKKKSDVQNNNRTVSLNAVGLNLRPAAVIMSCLWLGHCSGLRLADPLCVIPANIELFT